MRLKAKDFIAQPRRLQLQRAVRHHLADGPTREGTDEPLPSPSVNARAGALVGA